MESFFLFVTFFTSSKFHVDCKNYLTINSLTSNNCLVQMNTWDPRGLRFIPEKQTPTLFLIVSCHPVCQLISWFLWYNLCSWEGYPQGIISPDWAIWNCWFPDVFRFPILLVKYLERKGGISRFLCSRRLSMIGILPNELCYSVIALRLVGLIPTSEYIWVWRERCHYGWGSVCCHVCQSWRLCPEMVTTEHRYLGEW